MPDWLACSSSPSLSGNWVIGPIDRKRRRRKVKSILNLNTEPKNDLECGGTLTRPDETAPTEWINPKELGGTLWFHGRETARTSGDAGREVRQNS